MPTKNNTQCLITEAIMSSSLEKLETMYNFVQSRLKTVSSTLDLLPFINSLISFNNLKLQLSMTLHQIYMESKHTMSTKKKKKPKQCDTGYSHIQSLFFQLQRFNDVKQQLSLNTNLYSVNKTRHSSLLLSPSPRHASHSQKPLILCNQPPLTQHAHPALLGIDSKPHSADTAIADTAANCALSNPSKCAALRRIIQALLYYDNILNLYHQQQNDKHVQKQKHVQTSSSSSPIAKTANITDWSTYFNDRNYKHLLDDYHHILDHHLNRAQTEENNHEFELIHKEMVKYLKLCEVAKCDKFRQNRRVRENENIEILNCQHSELNHFYVETLDSIHCYFLHSYDIGMRLTAQDIAKINGDEHDEKEYKKQRKLKVDDNEFYTDHKLANLKQILNARLMPLRRQYVITGGQNKYFSNLNEEAQPTLPRSLAPRSKNVFNDHKQAKFETIVSEIIPHLQTPMVDVIRWLSEYIKDEEFTDEEAIRLDLDDVVYSDIRNNMQAHFKWSDDVTILILHILREDIFNDTYDSLGGVGKANRRSKNLRARSKSTFSTSTSYDFGHKFYYWEEYKENNQQDYGPNIGYRKKDWYIMKKYVNLKDEMINNKIYRLDLKRYHNIIKKAQMNMETTLCKAYKSADSLSSEYYKIKANSVLTLQNVMSLILYTDYVDLVFAFRTTFRPISDQETNEQLKNRHREYWNWSKLLSETVELYGESMSTCNVKVFYYGVSFLLSFPNFISHFCGPTSTTSHLEVSTIFSDDEGIILELVAENEYSNLKCFNCRFLSVYGHENEILFFGGYRPLKFLSIRLMSPSQNYAQFIGALNLFDHVVKAKKLSFDLVAAISKMDYKIIKSLMRHYMTSIEYKNRSPNYINNLFKSFCESKKYIHVNIACMNTQYPGFKKYLMCSVPVEVDERKHVDDGKRDEVDETDEYDNMLSFEIIAALFPYCEEIIVWETGRITANYVHKLVEQLRILNEQQRSILKRIKLCDVRYNGQLLSKQFETEYAARFEQHAFCKIQVDIKVRLQHENASQDYNGGQFREVPEFSHLVIFRQYRKYKASMKRDALLNGSKNEHQSYNNIMMRMAGNAYNGLPGQPDMMMVSASSISMSSSQVSAQRATAYHYQHHKGKRKKSKVRSRSYHRNKLRKHRKSSLEPIFDVNHNGNSSTAV